MDKKPYIYLDVVASASSAQFNVVDDFANASSIHDAGRDAFTVLEESRQIISQLIGASRPSELYFTSGATEANNMAILGIARAILQDPNKTDRRKILVCQTEHESSLLPAKHLAMEGFDVQFLPVDKGGFCKFQKFMFLCDEKTALVIVHHANTETGAIQYIKELVAVAHDNGAFFHSDCAGTFGWLPLNVCDMGVDSASFSGHKIGGPKGIGALYLKTGTPCEQITFGGSQEKGLRPGTVPVALAASFANAAKYSVENIPVSREKYREICTYLIKEISKIDGVRLTIDASENKYGYLWNILNLTYKNKSNKDLILQYGKRGIIVSGGPACSSESDEPSHVLRAIGIPDDEINGSIRISFSEKTSMEDVKAFIEATKEILK